MKISDVTGFDVLHFKELIAEDVLKFKGYQRSNDLKYQYLNGEIAYYLGKFAFGFDADINAESKSLVIDYLNYLLVKEHIQKEETTMGFEKYIEQNPTYIAMLEQRVLADCFGIHKDALVAVDIVGRGKTCVRVVSELNIDKEFRANIPVRFNQSEEVSLRIINADDDIFLGVEIVDPEKI